MYKISVILPVFNVENLLERALDSIINQTMDLSDIEVIMVDDCSTDGSRKIMEKYSNKYPNFISLYHEKNSGGCGFPRNTGLEVALGEYVMFLDPDDEFVPDNCEKLYNVINEYNADVAFGRYERVYPHLNKVEISSSPFSINLEDYYPIDKFDNVPVSNNLSFKQKIVNYFSIDHENIDKSLEIIYAENLQDNFELLKIAPSIWTKIYKKEFLLNNDFLFQREASEDVVFVIETFLKAKGIVFLNNFAGYVYYKYDVNDNESMTNKVSFKLLDEICDSYIKAGRLAKGFPRDIKSFYVRLQLNNWFGLWRNSDLTKDEINKLIKKLKKLKTYHTNVSFKAKLLFIYIITFMKISSYLK